MQRDITGGFSAHQPSVKGYFTSQFPVVKKSLYSPGSSQMMYKMIWGGHIVLGVDIRPGRSVGRALYYLFSKVSSPCRKSMSF